MSYKNTELIYFDPNFLNNQHFSGECSPASNEKRKEYLEKYVDVLKTQYGLGALPEKVVNETELEALTNQYAWTESNTKSLLLLDEMQAYQRNCFSPYKKWQFYTFGTKVQENILCFQDGITPPLPGAKYELNPAERVKEFVFAIWADKFYLNKTRNGTTTVSGRVFELRNGGWSIVKLQLFADGSLIYWDGSQLRTHPKKVEIGKCMGGEWHTVRILLGADSADVYFDEQLAASKLPLYGKENPDNFYIGGCRVPMGEWKVKPLLLKTENIVETEFFQQNEEKEQPETFLGTVKLPYVIGTHIHKDQELIFRKTFDFTPKKHAILTIKSIDPCGLVYLNGELICTAENFLTQKIRVENYLKEKDNLLEIIVKPRSPEVLYQWHRHSDPYNGWFCLGGFIESYNDNYAEDLSIITKSVQGGVQIQFATTVYGNGIAKLYVKKSYPTVEEEREIDAFAYYGRNEIKKDFTLDAEIWSLENPTLYQFILRLEENDGQIFEKSIETGFRTIEQKDGAIYLNGNRILLNGALSMQFLPPYENVPINHVCPNDQQIVMQIEQIKRMNGNTLRMHFLGYGTNDERFARFADRMGCLLIWTTRLIDSIEDVLVDPKWRQADAFAEQVKEVRQYPSIIMWEGSNEAGGSIKEIDYLYDQFVTAVKSVDTTRLICPCSHLYYGGGLYDSGIEGVYYQDDGLSDENFKPAKSSWGWTDASVVRSAHTYSLLLGYGVEWKKFVDQAWRSQPALFESRDHAYIISEYAIIGRACPYTLESKKYYNPNSYELGNEFASLGFWLSDGEYELSQAHQALCAAYANKKMRILDVDGMLWCCLQSGANDGSYLKPIIDFHGYAKFAFYILKDYYRDNYCVLDCDGPFWNKQSVIKPVLISKVGKYNVVVKVINEREEVVQEETYYVETNTWQTKLKPIALQIEKVGYYRIQTEVEGV